MLNTTIYSGIFIHRKSYKIEAKLFLLLIKKMKKNMEILKQKI